MGGTPSFHPFSSILVWAFPVHKKPSSELVRYHGLWRATASEVELALAAAPQEASLAAARRPFWVGFEEAGL